MDRLRRDGRCCLFALTFLSLLAASSAIVGEEDGDRESIYAPHREHLLNRLHRALFLRRTAEGEPQVHTIDPLLFRGGTFLLEGDSHRGAVALLDEFLASTDAPELRAPLKRLVLQRDLWAAFDYAAWYPDDWVHHSRHEQAAIALRTRLAKAVGMLSLSKSEIGALADNYALAVKSQEFPTEHDADHPERPFLPATLFDPAGPWVRFHALDAKPMAQEHFAGAGGRASHIILLRLPDGRKATERYLRSLGRDSVHQFPENTMVAMVRRALAVDASAKVRVTPITEMVQIRVYRRIPGNPRANFQGDFGEQDGYEFVLDRGMLLAGKHGLRPVGPDEPARPFARGSGDPFGPMHRSAVPGRAATQLKSCIQCHQAPGVHSVTSMRRGLQDDDQENFTTYEWNVELNYTVRAKIKRFEWGLLQGLLEARRTRPQIAETSPP